MGDRTARTTRAVTDSMGVVSTSSHALPEHDRSIVNYHLDVLDCNLYYIIPLGCYLVRGPSFPLRRDTVLSSAADGRRPVARTLGQGSRIGCGHRAWTLRSKELCYICVCADAGGLL